MEITIASLMLIVGLVIAGIGLFKGYRTRNVKTAMNVVSVILIAVPLLVMGNFIDLPILTKPIGTPAGLPTISTTPLATKTLTTTTVPALCPVEDTTVTLSAQDKYTSASTGGSHRYRICNDNGCSPAKTVTDGSTLTASPGDVIEVLYYNGSTTGYFSAYEKYTVPCSGTKTFYTTLVNNGSLTTQVWNEEGDLIDSSGNNETLAAGDVVSLDMKVKGEYKKEFPYGLVLVVEYNKTTIDDVVVNLGGTNLVETEVPESYSATYGSDSAKVAFDVPAVISNEILSGTVTIDADDSEDPLVDGSDILLTYYPKNYYINEDKGGSFDGPAAEDEDNSVTRTGQFTYTLHID